MRDGRVDVYDSGCGVKNPVTIDTHRHGGFRRSRILRSPSESAMRF